MATTTCPLCCGRKIVMGLADAKPAAGILLGGRLIPTVSVGDRPCGMCAGTGQVPDDHPAVGPKRECKS